MKTINPQRLIQMTLVVLAASLVISIGVVLASHSNVSPTPLWGYEAAGANAAMSLYDIGADVLVSSCVPAGGAVPPNVIGNGRGVAYDPIDGNLWYTVLNAGILTGDGLIHKTATTCGADILTIPAPQTSIGALDIDPDDGHIWAAGYQPIGGFSFFYKVSRGAPGPPPGTVMQSCQVPFAGGGVGNDTLAVAKLSGLPGSGKYLLTDAGELIVGPGNLQVLDAAACVGGGPVAPVTTYTTPLGLTGIDYEPVGSPPVNKLIATDLFSIVDLGGPPFSTVLATMSTFGHALEDITLKTAPVVISVPVDIRPESCPNPLNTNDQGVLPVAILGTSTFDVTQVDVSTVKLAGVSPLRSDLEDVATPFSPFTGKSSCLADCNALGPDGFIDLTLKFDAQAVVAALGPLTDGECVVVKLTGNLSPAFGGTPIAGEDVVIIRLKK